MSPTPRVHQIRATLEALPGPSLIWVGVNNLDAPLGHG